MLAGATAVALFVRAHLVVDRCQGLFGRNLWAQAGVACASEARAGDPHAGPLAARALLYHGRSDGALAEAERWFGTEADASARQAAGEIYLLDRDDRDPVTGPLRTRLAAQCRGGEHGEAAHTARRLTTALMEASKLTVALDAAHLAIREADLTHDRRLQGHALLAQGSLLNRIGDLAKARTALLDAQLRLISWPADQARVQLELGMLARANGDEAGSVEILTRALRLTASPGVPDPELAIAVELVAATARIQLARAERQLGRLDAAEAHLRALAPEWAARPAAKLAAGLIAADRGRRAEAKWLLEEAGALLAEPASVEDRDDAIDVAVERGLLAERAEDPAAAEASYRRAIAIVEELRRDTKSVELRPWVLASRRAPYEALVSLLARADRRLDALVIAEHLHARTLLDARVDRERTQAPVSDLERRLRGPVAAPALRAAELRSILQDREVLVFSQARETIWRFHIVGGEIASMDRLPEDTIGLARNWVPSDSRRAEELGDRLIPPAAREPSSRPLYIVSSGKLAEQPFAALRPGGRYLVETRDMLRIPGLGALQCQSGPSPAQEVAFLGDSRGDLPKAREEVTTLAEQRGVRALVGESVTLEALQAARGASLLHVAVHGNPGEQGRVLRLADRDATAADILDRRIAPHVAVLSGSATAASRDVEGWGALSSAFLAAGSRSVVATLQAVPDTVGLEVMQRFYAAGGEQRPAQALAAAQRGLLAAALHGPIETSTAWSSFVVDGAGAACDTGPR